MSIPKSRRAPVALLDELAFADGLGLTVRSLRSYVREGRFPPFAQARGKPYWLAVQKHDALAVLGERA